MARTAKQAPKRSTTSTLAELQSALEHVGTNVFMSDANLRITFINAKARETLKAINNTIVDEFGISHDRILGRSVDQFHRDPDFLRSLLSDPSNLPHAAEISIGPIAFRLYAAPVFNAGGKFTGTVVNLERTSDDAPSDSQACAISRLLDEVFQGTVQIDEGASQIASASLSLSEGASEQAANLEQISSALVEMSSMTQKNAENARLANVLSEEAQQSADRGLQEMSEMSTAMNEIKASSAEISKIIKVIDEIAFQTNLLALNAAVEAARAGEAGKGFAVVAEEVRNLAQRSAEAAKNTSAMIEESTRRADNGVSIAERVGTVLEEIVAGTKKVNTLLSEIASASQEQADGITQINTGVSELDKVTQQNAGNSEELASAAQETAAQVTSLRDLIAQFELKGGESAPGEGGTSSRVTATPSSAAHKVAVKKPSAGSRSASSWRDDAKRAIPFDDDDVFESF